VMGRHERIGAKFSVLEAAARGPVAVASAYSCRQKPATHLTATRGGSHGSAWLMEFFIVLMHRELPAWRSILYPITRVGLPVLIGAILCSFFYDQGYNLTGISNVMGVIFISSLLPIFMAQVFVEVRQSPSCGCCEPPSGFHHRPASLSLIQFGSLLSLCAVRHSELSRQASD
jgi:hypothetical protein